MRKRLLIFLIVLCTSAVFASTALAGSYTVYSCKTPSGAAAPTDGWQSTISGNQDLGFWHDHCPNLVVLAFAGNLAHPAGSYVDGVFSAPAGRRSAPSC